MSVRRRGWCGVVVLWAVASAAPAQQVMLGEEFVPGAASRIDITLAVEGRLKVVRDEKPEAVPLKAKANHSILEQADAADAKGGVGTALRYYLAASSEAEVGSERSKRDLSNDRRLVVAKRTAEGTLHYSPDGPLYREELELVAEHFDTLCVPALLPGKAMSPGETWPIGPEAAQHACLFEGLIKNELVGKFVEVKDGAARFTITGKTEGLECGANARLTISAAGTFDLVTKRVVELVWEQTDDRDQGPASPATEVKATVTLKRVPLADKPKELADAAPRAKLPDDGKIPDILLSLRYADPAGRYGFVYRRDWRVVGRTRGHLVLRLVEKGEFTAQATVTGWQKAAPGHHASPADYKAVLAKLPGWEVEGAMEEGEVPTDPGRWLYRVAGKGKQDGLPVVQIFYLLAGPEGDQVAVTVVAQPEKAARLSPKDLMLVNAIELPLKR